MIRHIPPKPFPQRRHPATLHVPSKSSPTATSPRAACPLGHSRQHSSDIRLCKLRSRHARAQTELNQSHATHSKAAHTSLRRLTLRSPNNIEPTPNSPNTPGHITINVCTKRINPAPTQQTQHQAGAHGGTAAQSCFQHQAWSQQLGACYPRAALPASDGSWAPGH